MPTPVNIEFWQSRVLKYNPRAFAVHRGRPHPNPVKVAHAFSAGKLVENDARYYAFTSTEDLKRFLVLFPKAKACSNPLRKD